MTGDRIPTNPSVLNTTVISNFAYIDHLWVVTGLSGICTVPVVREELEDGVDDHPYLRSALDEWLSTWIDDIGYYVPYRTIPKYR